jgi:hypothetical protein
MRATLWRWWRPRAWPPQTKKKARITAWEDESRRAGQEAAATELTRQYVAFDQHDAAAEHQCPRCRRRMSRLGVRTRYVVTSVGTLHVPRHVYYCRACQRTSAPLDAALDMQHRQESKPVRQWCARLGAALPYAEGAALLGRLTDVALDAATIEELCVTAGAKLVALQRTRGHAVPPPDGPLYIGIDGANMRVRDPERPWQEVRVGTIFTTRPGPAGPALVRKEYVAELGSLDVFGATVWACAERWGVMDAKLVVVLGDGAKENWGLAAMYFPGAIEILDFYHACQHLKDVRNACFPVESDDGDIWLATQCSALKRGWWCRVVAAMAALAARGSERRKILVREVAYFRTNQQRMRYSYFRRLGLSSGSGVVESGCKHVVTRRMKVSGASWHPQRAQAILCLRCAYLTRTDLLDQVA